MEEGKRGRGDLACVLSESRKARRTRRTRILRGVWLFRTGLQALTVSRAKHAPTEERGDTRFVAPKKYTIFLDKCSENW